jgi:putative DNA primase/helicase
MNSENFEGIPIPEPFEEGSHSLFAATVIVGYGPGINELNECLDHAEPLDFHFAADLTLGEKIRRSDEVVCVINAVLNLLRVAGFDLMYMWGRFYLYLGTHWQKISDRILRACLVAASIRFGVRNVSAIYHRYAADLMNQASSLTEMDQPERDPSVVLMNFQNGTLRINAGTITFGEHRKEERLTYVLPTIYDPAATAPLFQKYLERCVPHPSSQDNLGEFMGSIFTRIKHEKALLLLGPGDNGKSVFFDVMAGVLGTKNVTMRVSKLSIMNMGARHWLTFFLIMPPSSAVA